MIDINATFISESLIFSVLILCTYKYVWPLIDGVIESRRQFIESELSSVQDLRDGVNKSLEDLKVKKNSEQLISQNLLKDTRVKISELKKINEEDAKRMIARSRNLCKNMEAAHLEKVKKEYIEELHKKTADIIGSIYNAAIDKSEQDQLAKNIIDTIIEEL